MRILLTIVLALLVSLGALAEGSSEQKCIDLGSACSMSEPFNTNSYTCVGGACGPGGTMDFGDSEGAGAKEATSPWNWGATAGIVPTASSVSDVALPTGTSQISFVLKAIGDGNSTVRQMTHGTIPGGTQRRCMRFYKKFSTDFRGFDSPPPSCRANKQQELWGGRVQHSESGGGNFILAAAVGWQFPPPCNNNTQICSTGAPLRWQNCVNNWCREEICLSGDSPGDINSGTDLSLSGYVTQVGVPSPLTITYPKTLLGDQVAGGLTGSWVFTSYRELCTQASDGYFYASHAMVADWPDDTDQTIGPASEVEGGGGPILNLSLNCSPNTGVKPLTGVTCVADPVNEGTGPDYRFKFDCNNDSVIEQTINVNNDTTPVATQTSAIDACDATYATNGTYTAKVTLEDYANQGAGVGTPVATATAIDTVIVTGGVLAAPVLLNQ